MQKHRVVTVFILFRLHFRLFGRSLKCNCWRYKMCVGIFSLTCILNAILFQLAKTLTHFIYLSYFFLSGELYSKSVVTFSLIHTLIKCDDSKMFFYYMNFLIDEICRPIKILSQSEIKRIQIALRVMFSWNNIWNRIEIVVPMLIIILVRVDESRCCSKSNIYP